MGPSEKSVRVSSAPPTAPGNKTEEDLRALLEAIPDGLLILAGDGTVRDSNRRAEEMFCYGRGKLFGRPAELLLPNVLGAIRARQNSGPGSRPESGCREANLESTARRKDGSIFPVSIRWDALPAEESIGIAMLVTDISALKQAQEALKESEAKYRVLVERIPAVTYVAPADDLGKSLYVSPQIQSLLGYTAEEWLANPGLFLTHIHADDRERVFAAAAQSHTSDKPLVIEYRIFTREGSLRFVRDEATLVRDSAGKPLFFQGIMLDVTERKQAEEALRLSEERYRDLVENIEELICTHDLKGNILSANRALVRKMGYETAEEMMRLNIRDMLVPATRHLFEQYLRTIEQEGHSRGLMRVQTRQGQERILEYENTLRRCSGGSAIVRGVSRDVTERIWAQKTLDELRRRNQLILDAAGEGICGLDSEGKVAFANPAAARLTGWTVEELVGRAAHELIHHTRPDGSPHSFGECLIQASFKDGAVRHVEDEWFWRKDGSGFPVEYTSTPLRDEERRLAGAVVVFQDISQRREIERLKDEFISMVSHELRTPLTAIHGALGLLATGQLGILPETGQRMLEIAATNTDRMVRLVNDILDLERLESGLTSLEKGPCEVAALLNRSADAMRAVADQAGIEINVGPNSARVWADPDRIIQTLTNLVSNAIKFSSRGETVRLTAETDQQHVLFCVRDHGRGIPSDHLRTIFGRFRQVDPADAREKGGTGLGLAICASIVQQHGGRIWAESQPGRGSSFCFTLPLAEDGQNQHPE